MSGAARIRWQSSEGANSQTLYGLTAAYGRATSVQNADTPVTEHDIEIAGLTPCTTYHYTASSTDQAGNSSQGADSTLTTRGCAGDAEVLAQSAQFIAQDASSVLSLIAAGTGLTLSVPANVAGTDLHFQIKRLEKQSALDALGTPENYLTAGNYVFDLRALSDVQTLVSSFDTPLTVSINYAASDLSGVDESSLRLFRNDGAGWQLLPGCSVNRSARSVTCTTTHFSTFSLFGAPAQSNPEPQTPRTRAAITGTTVRARVQNLQTMSKVAQAEAVIREWPQQFPERGGGNATGTSRAPGVGGAYGVRDLHLGMSGADVRALQMVLVAQKAGPAAHALEVHGITSYFGQLTFAALVEYQKKVGIVPHSGRFGPLTRVHLKSVGASGLWW
jgi:hypothetical protein